MHDCCTELLLHGPSAMQGRAMAGVNAADCVVQTLLLCQLLRRLYPWTAMLIYSLHTWRGLKRALACRTRSRADMVSPTDALPADWLTA